jgi:RIO1 family
VSYIVVMCQLSTVLTIVGCIFVSVSSPWLYRLYGRGRLVHGDLSEYNILVAPAYLVQNVSSAVENVKNESQAVLIDFGQAVDEKHPEADQYLRRDLERVRLFFAKQGVQVMSAEDALKSVHDYADKVKAERLGNDEEESKVDAIESIDEDGEDGAEDEQEVMVQEDVRVDEAGKAEAAMGAKEEKSNSL